MGRALVCEAKLEEAHNELDEMFDDLSKALSGLVGFDAARAWVETRYGRPFATSIGAAEFVMLVRDIIAKKSKETK